MSCGKVTCHHGRFPCRAGGLHLFYPTTVEVTFFAEVGVAFLLRYLVVAYLAAHGGKSSKGVRGMSRQCAGNWSRAWWCGCAGVSRSMAMGVSA